MAMFHFRLKSDKKPDGTKISAVQHVEYINRVDNFSSLNQHQENNHFVGNLITSAEIKNACDGLNTLLYKTDLFGSIRNSNDGIEITENVSPTTISIALLLAHESMNHQPLILRGSPNFQKAVLQAAILDDLPVSFADKLTQNEFLRLKEALALDRKNFVANGGKIIIKRPIPQPCHSITHAKSIQDATQIGFRLPTLSQLSLVHSESAGTDLLLSSDESTLLDELAKKSYNLVRWNFSAERKQLAQRTANQILQLIQDDKAQTFAESHIEYINRENAFANRGGCIFHAHHLPKWAHDDPKRFFKAADKYEGKNNRRYMEIEFALPNELNSVQQYRQIIDPFLEKHLKNHYYAYAIHDKIGMMSDGQRHPHVHIMFSERLIDDVEKTKERPAKFFFLYPARKKKEGSQPSFQEKWQRGAPKNRNWADKSFLAVLRADFAQIQNEVLERNGFSIRVDHRTLEAQKEDAEKNGDSFLARLFNRIPEKYVGVISCLDDDNPKLQRLKEFRTLRKQHFDLILKLDAISKETDELETKDAALSASTHAKNFISSREFSTQKFVSQYQQELKAKLFSAIAEVNKWKRTIISHHDAELQAKLEYMTKSERELWLKYYETLAQKKNLEEFLKTLHKPNESQKKALDAYYNLVDGIHSKIFSLLSAIALMKKSVENIERRLDSPDCKKNILLVTHQLLQANLYAKKMLRRESENLEHAIDALKNDIVAQTVADDSPKNIFKTREVYDLIRRQFFGLKKEYERTLDRKSDLQRQIISPQRALTMAKNIFVHGDFKRLREQIRRYKKDEQKLAQNLLAFNQRENIFLSRDWTADNRSAFLQEKYFLTKEKTLLEVEKVRLANLKLALEQRQADLDSLCQKPDSLNKIEEIAAGILRKNFKFVRQLEETETKAKQLAQRLNHAKEQLDALKIRLDRDKFNTAYKVIPNSYSNTSAASIIADAILFEPQAVQLVARSNGNNLEMDKDWELMSELDKDEFIRKKIIREL